MKLSFLSSYLFSLYVSLLLSTAMSASTQVESEGLLHQKPGLGHIDQRWSGNWCQPAIMYAAFATGVVFAIAHHVLYSVLQGQQTGDQERQQWSIRYVAMHLRHMFIRAARCCGHGGVPGFMSSDGLSIVCRRILIVCCPAG